MTLEKIAAFQKEYQGSKEEREDVLRAYVDCQGKMARVIDCVMLANDGASIIPPFIHPPVPRFFTIPIHPHTIMHETEDEPRFRELIEGAIKAKEVPRFKGFKAQVKNDSKRAAKASKVRTTVHDPEPGSIW